MLRVTIILAAFILLAYAAFDKVRPRVETAPTSRTAHNLTSVGADRISGPVIFDESDKATFPGAYFPPAPPPFDLGTSTRPDPKHLARDPDHEARAKGEIYSVTAPSLTLRAGPSSGYAEIATLVRGQKVVSFGAGTGGWLWVTSEDTDQSGYLASELVARVP